MKNKGVRILFILFSVSFALVLSGANLWLGDLNQDEGWYLAAARCCRGGLLPYRDFFFTQAPLMPLVYGRLGSLWEPSGLLGARFLTAALGLLAALCAAATAARVAPARRRFAAAATTFLLLAGNVYHSYFTTIPKTYALASLLLAGGFCAISFADSERRRARDSALVALGGFLLAAAASARLSLGLALAAGGCYLLARSRTLGNRWLYFGSGGALGLALLLLPFALADFEAFKFANFFHGGREPGGLLFSAGSLSRLIRNYMPLFLLLLAAVAVRLFAAGAGKAPRARDDGGGWNVGLWAVSFLAVFLLQLFSPFPYDDYQVPVMPLAAAAASVVFWKALPDAPPGERGESNRQARLLFLFLFCAAAFAFTSPLNESWMMIRKDRFWVVSKEETDLSRLRKTAALLSRELQGRDKLLLTTDPYLAIEARCEVYPGFEMGPFGFFPDLENDLAHRFHVYNRSILDGLLADKGRAPELIAFSGYGFAVAAPAMTRYPEAEREKIIRSLAGRYVKIREVPDFGQEHTVLEVWRRK